jgi:hypothetical protein
MAYKAEDGKKSNLWTALVERSWLSRWWIWLDAELALKVRVFGAGLPFV